LEPTPVVEWQVRPKFQDRVWLHLLLFALTIVTTTVVGVGQYVGFLVGFVPAAAHLPALSRIAVIANGFWYSGTILAILGCHELGHYFACRYYDVDATLPFFIPMPLAFTGTLGAVIKIREPFPNKRALFDIGIAGPIAGFLVLVPALLVGIALSKIEAVPPGFVGAELGEPLLLKMVTWLFWGHTPAGYSLNLHPMAFGAWFGMLATALNLFPMGQLDGGHIAYAVLGRRSVYVTYVTLAVVATLTVFASSWIFFTVLMIVMLALLGPRHPMVWDEHIPLDRGRLLLALFAVVMFALCFTPAPITISDLTAH
jgi:membrane-associated protease RseP (regulator of RpoE activity)